MGELTYTAAMELLARKNYQEVYDQAIAALRRNEQNPLAFFFLGIVASDHGQHSKALEFFAKATEHESGNVRYQVFHAKALITLGHDTDAALRVDKATKSGTSDAFLADMIANIYSRTGQQSEAYRWYERAVKLNPNWATFQFNLGASAQFNGDIDAAKIAYKKALSLDPKFYRAWFSLVSLEPQTLEDNHLETLKALYGNVGQDANAALLLGHSIAKTLEDLGQFSESFDWLGKAKRLKKSAVNYDRHETARVFEAARLAPHAPSVSEIESQGITPVFIVGLPRTGTTLVDRILSSHANVTSVGEHDLFAELIREQTSTVGFLNPQTFASATRVDLEEIGHRYVEKMQVLSKGHTHVIDKTPLNFLHAGLIHRALPHAKIVTLRRGALDSCLSNYRQLFAFEHNRYPYAYDLEDTAEFFREFDALITHWKRTLPKDQFMECRYEEVVLDQENQTRQLLAFCGLTWDEACLRFHENAAAVDTASSVQVRQPLYSGAIDRWKKYDDRLDTLKAILGALAAS